MLQLGSRFGDYTVVRPLGKGGMGEVWLLKSSSGTEVAVKLLGAEASANHESRKRFVREAQLAMGVKHPNLVETYDVGEDPESGLCYILMEYVSGGSLAGYLKEHGALPIGDAVAVVQAMADVLELARQKGVVHRDIKPANIMFTADGTPKLADLGIARGGSAGEDTTTVTQTGAMIGTPAYMAPEQMLDAHHVDTRADIYSLGVVFFEMLTGERPNKDDTVVQLMAKAVKGEPLPDVRTLRPEVSASLAQLLNMMVAPDKDGRISTPGQITSALNIIERGGKLEVASTGSGGRGRPPGVPQREDKAFSWKILIPVVILGVLAAVFFVLTPNRESMRQVVMTNVVECVVEKPVIQTVVRTNVVERVVERIAEKPRDAKSPVGKPDAGAKTFEVSCEHILIVADQGVKRDFVDGLAKRIEEMLPTYLAVFGDCRTYGLTRRQYRIRIQRPEPYRNFCCSVSEHEWTMSVDATGKKALSDDEVAHMIAASLSLYREPNWESLVFYAITPFGNKRVGIGYVIREGRALDKDCTLYSWNGKPLSAEAPPIQNSTYYTLRHWRTFAVLEELRKSNPNLMRDYNALKLSCHKAGKIGSVVSFEQEVDMLSEAAHSDARTEFFRYGFPVNKPEVEDAGNGGILADGHRTPVDAEKLSDADPTRAVQKALDALFPGWKTSEVGSPGKLGYWSERDGIRDVICTHPPRRGEPVAISRKVKLSGKCPALKVKLTNNEPGAEFRFRVRVNGDVVREKDIRDGWTDVYVDLSKWAGKTVSVNLEHWPTGWRSEWAFWAVIEIADSAAWCETSEIQSRAPVVKLLDRQKLLGKRPDRFAQRTCDALFPGWKVSECGHPEVCGYEAEHKGRYNLLMTHPPREDVPVVISRRMTIPRHFPKLYLSVIGGEDFELQVKVNGKILLRPDVNGREWTDLEVDLAKWAGQTAKIELLNMPTGWRHEEAHWQRIEVK